MAKLVSTLHNGEYEIADASARANSKALQDSVSAISTELYGGNVKCVIEQGSVNTNTGTISTRSDYIRTSLIQVTENTEYVMKILSNAETRLSAFAVFYDSNETFISSTGIGWVTPGNGNYVIKTPENTHGVRFRFSYDPASTISTDIISANITWGESWKAYVDTAIVASIKDRGTIYVQGLDLNSGEFINPGIWQVDDDEYVPYHCPTCAPCRIISYSSYDNDANYVYQMVVDRNGKRYTRFLCNNWTPWISDKSLHDDIAFKCLFINSGTYRNDKTIVYDTSTNNRVAKLMAKWDAIAPTTGIIVDKEILGKDASNTYDIYNYKVSNGSVDKPIVLVIFGEHGNEYSSAEVGSYFYKEVINGVLTPYLRYVDFWLIPLMNPWGYENKNRNNANDVNLNRDFPCEWKYSVDQHDKTWNYSISQPETQYLYNLFKDNKDKILFFVNKHNTGSISNKIYKNELGIAGYTSSLIESDAIYNRGLTMWEDAQVKETDAWIYTDCSVDISTRPAIADRSGLVTPGSMDLFANSIGIHGSLLEVASAVSYDTDAESYYSEEHFTDLSRLELDFIVNYVAKAIENTEYILRTDNLMSNLKYWTRIEGGSDIDIQLEWLQGSINTNTGAESTSTQRCRSNFGEVSGNVRSLIIIFKNKGTESIGLQAIYYDESQKFMSSDTKLGKIAVGVTTTKIVTPVEGAAYVRFRVQYDSLSDITPEEFEVNVKESGWKNQEMYWNGHQLIEIDIN